MQKKLLFSFFIMATWMVVSCTPTGTGCYGYWEKREMDYKEALERGGILIINTPIDNVSMKII